MLELLLFEDSQRALEYFKEHSIDKAFLEVDKLRKLILNDNAPIEIDHAFDIAGLFYTGSNIDAMSQLARIEVRLLQVKYYMPACEHAEKELITLPKLTWKI